MLSKTKRRKPRQNKMKSFEHYLSTMYGKNGLEALNNLELHVRRSLNSYSITADGNERDERMMTLVQKRKNEILNEKLLL